MAAVAHFADITIEQLEAGGATWLDELPFGVIGITPEGDVDVYNTTESHLAGLSATRVVGRRFFSEIGICMNNFMVAQRFEDEPRLDAVIDYVLTLRMRPTPVKLRLLQDKPGIARSYVLVQR
jgi:photoactive yellow protein